MDIINYSAGLITSFHMLDAGVRGMFTPCNEIAFTNTIKCVLCIADTLSDVWWGIRRVQHCPLNCIQRCSDIFNKLLCYNIWTLYYISDTHNYMDVLDSNLQ